MDGRFDTVEFAVEGDLFKDGNAVKGVQKTTWNGKYLIDSDALSELLMKSKRCDQLEKSNSHMMGLVMSGKLSQGGREAPNGEEANALKGQLQKAQEEIRSLNQKLAEAESAAAQSQKELVPADYNRYLNKLSAESRGRKRMQAAAISLSLAIRGKAPFEIAVALSNRGFGSSAAYVSRLLSTLDDGDKIRLRSAMDAHPEEFEGISEADFEAWFAVRHKKQQKTHDKRLKNRMNEWGE